MENNIVNQTPSPQFTPPAGATIVGEGNAPQMQQQAPIPQQVITPQQTSSVESPKDFFGNINWLEVLVYTSIITLTFIGINYYRSQNKLANDEIVKQNERISTLESEIVDITTPH